MKGIYGSEVETALKFHLAINGHKEYQDDPDVQAIFEKAKKTFKTTQNNTKKTSIDEKINQLTEIVEKQQKTINKLENQSRREVSKKYGHAEFKKQFKMAFQNYHQVSRKDLERFIMNKAEVVDKRAIQSRITYLESHGIIETYAPMYIPSTFTEHEMHTHKNYLDIMGANNNIV